ncbi:serine hydrolase domain-containing protein [Nonomuraea dietziae]|uniref:serine hydrolase domain-containing protein n=1 Tax=Nonomuraea dietziae TaxID=65515 RepID=UPI0033E29C79
MGRDLESIVQEAAGGLAAGRSAAVVGVLAEGRTEIRGAGPGAPDGDTVFEIGSVTKVFTALALARQVVAGTAALDEPVRDLLPAGTAMPAREGREVSLRHLAQHTSGLPRLPKGAIWQMIREFPNGDRDPYARYDDATILAGLAGTRLRSLPGTRFRYSNLGAGLLGLALATRAGTDYATLLTEDVCKPLGMTRTNLGEPVIQGHTRRGRPTPPWNMAALAGAGGLRSTAADLLTFLQAQIECREEAIGLSRRTEHRVNPLQAVQLGWMETRLHPKIGGGRRIWHNGRTGGFASYVGFDPERRIGVVVLSGTARSVDSTAATLFRTLAT